jgi:hypothetical protein
MKSLGLLLAVVAVVGFVTVASTFAAEEGGKAPGGRPTFGELTKIDGKVLTISVKREDTTTEQTATVTDETEIFTQAPAKLESLKVGDRVSINQEGKRYFGEITKIDGKTITLKGRREEEQTVTVDDKTTITTRVKGKFEDLKVGQRVSVSIKEGKAVRVEVRGTAERAPAKAKEKE